MSTPASDVHERMKTNGTAIKIMRDYQQSRKDLVKHLQRQQFSFSKKVFKSLSLKLKFIFEVELLVFAFFKDEQRQESRSKL